MPLDPGPGWRAKLANQPEWAANLSVGTALAPFPMMPMGEAGRSLFAALNDYFERNPGRLSDFLGRTIQHTTTLSPDWASQMISESDKEVPRLAGDKAGIWTDAKNLPPGETIKHFVYRNDKGEPLGSMQLWIKPMRMGARPKPSVEALAIDKSKGLPAREAFARLLTEALDWDAEWPHLYTADTANFMRKLQTKLKPSTALKGGRGVLAAKGKP